jgi:hypothetical protein
MSSNVLKGYGLSDESKCACTPEMITITQKLNEAIKMQEHNYDCIQTISSKLGFDCPVSPEEEHASYGIDGMADSLLRQAAIFNGVLNRMLSVL